MKGKRDPMALPVYIGKYKAGSMVDGPGGPRTVVWFSGCPIRCPGCQNKALWVRRAKQGVPVSQAVEHVLRLATDGRPITITGGEPFDQSLALATMIQAIRKADDDADRPRRHIIVYTGYTLTALQFRSVMDRYIDDEADYIMQALLEIDVLVDGPYMEQMADDAIQHMGSRNQHAIDIPATIESGGLEPLGGDNRHLVTYIDWNACHEIQVRDGKLIGTSAAMASLGLTGNPVEGCGEYRGGTIA